MEAQQQIHSLTGFRFMAALMVLVGHSATVLPQWWLTRMLLGLAPTGMILFFVLSGFVIWLNYAESIVARRPGALRDFAVARFARLYPMYVVILVLAFMLTGIIHGGAAVMDAFPGAFAMFFALQAWVPTDLVDNRLLIFSIPYTGHLWSISTELFFYACFPMIVALLSRFHSKASILIVAMINILALGLVFHLCMINLHPLTMLFAPSLPETDSTMWLTYYAPYMRIFQFLAGCIVCQLYLSLLSHVPGRMETNIVRILALAALLGVIGTVILFSISLPPKWYSILAVLSQVAPVAAVSFLMLYVARYRSKLRRLLSLPKMLALGDASYSIYLWHPFLIEAVRNATLGILLSWGIAGHLTFIGLVVGSVVLFSLVTYHFVEAPARRFLRRGFHVNSNAAVMDLHTAKT